MKNFLRITSSGLLKLALFSAAITASLVSVFASPTSLKESLADNKLYDGLVQNVLDAARKNNDISGESAAPADKQLSLNALETAAKQAFTPEVLQSSTEQALDGIYHWLNGEVESPDFRIDLTQAKANFIAAAGAEVEKHAASLPVCTTTQARTIDPDADPFSLTCRPATLSPADVRNNAVAELNKDNKFIPNPVLSADNLSKDANGETFFDKAEGARSLYQVAKVLPWILLILSGLLAAGLLFLNETKRKGIKNIGVTLLGTGLFLLVTGWLTGFLFDKAARPGGMLSKSIENEFQESILAAVRSLNSLFNRTILIYCLVYIALGAAALIALRFTRPKVAEAIPEENKELGTKPDTKATEKKKSA